MPGLFITAESLVQAVQWKLGLGAADDLQSPQVWSGFLQVPHNQSLVEQLGGFLTDPVGQAVRLQLELSEPEGGWCDDPEFLRELWEASRKCLQNHAEHWQRIESLLKPCQVRQADSGSTSSEKAPAGGEMSDQNLHLNGDEILKAIRWKLGIPSDNDPLAQRYWDLFCSIQHSRAFKGDVAQVFGILMRDAVLMELGVKVNRSAEEQHLLMDLWKAYKSWFNSLRAPNRYSSKVSELIHSQLPGKGLKLPPGQTKPPPQQTGAVRNPPGAVKSGPPPTSDGKHKTTATNDPKPSDAMTALPGDSVNVDPASTSDRPVISAGWRFKPAPADEPDAHEEDAKAKEPMTPGWNFVGARVRGKKHKHEGTHCDDWFEVRACGPWVLMAVSDGAGSYRFSRVGAKVSCNAALEYLAAKFQERTIGINPGGALEEWWHPERGYLRVDDCKSVSLALQEAMGVALDAVKQAARAREDQEAYQKILGRKIKEDDLSATLLLTACTTVIIEGVEYTYMATCSVGDGMIAAVTLDGKVQLLATPDGGEHASETYFLTSKGRLDPKTLEKKSPVAFRPIRALMLMTDGVADDYFPPDPEMLRLYADLVLNRVLPLPSSAVPPPPEYDEARIACETEMDVLAAEPQKFKIRSAGSFAAKMNMEVKQLVASPELLQAGAWTETPDAITDPAERLRLWLDTYQVRGSFDDRTLVVLHREVLS